MKRLDGKAALVTGTAHGTGRSCARAHVRVAVAVADAERARDAADAIVAQGHNVDGARWMS